MTQGFGRGPKLLGYVLLLLPEVNAYAASPSQPGLGEQDFHGLTNRLEGARLWRKRRGARNAILNYMSAFAEPVSQHGTHMVLIERLERLANGELSTSVVCRVDITEQFIE